MLFLGAVVVLFRILTKERTYFMYSYAILCMLCTVLRYFHVVLPFNGLVGDMFIIMDTSQCNADTETIRI